MQTVTTVRFSVFANGAKRANVIPSRGLRQGDPLSPYLFLLVIDVLSRLLKKGVADNHFSGIKLGPCCPIISHFFFANDAILFAKANKDECENVLKILNVYNKASGQLLNLSKSGVSFSSNIPIVLCQELCDLLCMPPLSKKARYLGLPTFWGKSKMEAYNFLLEKTISKLQGWKKITLTQAGKEVLIKSVVQAIPSYAMACFALPKRFCDKLNSYISNFWWSGNPENRGVHWASWDHATQSKFSGGLGFRDFKAFNVAMLAKQGWRLTINPNTFWGSIMKGLYYPNSNFLQAAKGNRPSWAWSSLLQGREILLKGIRWQVANGSKILFWNDNWLPSSQDFKVHTARAPDCPLVYVQDFIDQRSKTWKEADISRWVSQEEANEILSIPISHNGKVDFLVWHYEPKDHYTVKSGYHLARELQSAGAQPKASSSFNPPRALWKFIWSMNIPLS